MEKPKISPEAYLDDAEHNSLDDADYFKEVNKDLRRQGADFHIIYPGSQILGNGIFLTEEKGANNILVDYNLDHQIENAVAYEYLAQEVRKEIAKKSRSSDQNMLYLPEAVRKVINGNITITDPLMEGDTEGGIEYLSDILARGRGSALAATLAAGATAEIVTGHAGYTRVIRSPRPERLVANDQYVVEWRAPRSHRDESGRYIIAPESGFSGRLDRYLKEGPVDRLVSSAIGWAALSRGHKGDAAAEPKESDLSTAKIVSFEEFAAKRAKEASKDVD